MLVFKWQNEERLVLATTTIFSAKFGILTCKNYSFHNRIFSWFLCMGHLQEIPARDISKLPKYNPPLRHS